MSRQDLRNDFIPSEDDIDPETDQFFYPFQTRSRSYLHFDPRISSNEVRNYDFSKEFKRHRFLPLLGFTDQRHRVIRDEVTGKLKVKPKERPIRYASHTDSHYLQAYAQHLSKSYEAAIRADGISNAVLAYRKGGKTNIHHAKCLFDEVRSRGNCTVIALDVKGFFDSLRHDHLEDELVRLTGKTALGGHDLTIFKNLTRYSWVEIADLDAVLGKKRRLAGLICSRDDFYKNVRGRKTGLIRTNETDIGIPQGTPLSGLYANIYMRSADKDISAFLTGR